MNKIFALFVLALTTATPAMAELDLGEYRGVGSDGSPCSFVVRSVTFVGGVHHPLNERVAIDVLNRSYELAHLPVINRGAGTVSPEGGFLTGAFAAASGQVYAASLAMAHRPDFHGPEQLLLIANEGYLVCGQLAFVAQP
jgi:hypothetical protein